MREISTRYGTKTPDELFDRAVEKMDNIVETTCGCCGRTFYTLSEELYRENVYNSDPNDMLQQVITTVKTVKCPHCGFATSIGALGKKLKGYYGL